MTAQSAAAGSKPVSKRRTFTKAQRRAMARYHAKHGHTATTDKFEVSPGVVTRAVRDFGTKAKIAAAQHKVAMPTLVLARKLKRLCASRISESGDVGDLELTALLLVKDVTRGTGRE